TLCQQLLSPLVGLSSLIRLGKGAEPDELKHLRQRLRRPRNLAPVPFPHQLKNLSHRPRRVEVVGESFAKRLDAGGWGGLGGASPLLLRRDPPVLPDGV